MKRLRQLLGAIYALGIPLSLVRKAALWFGGAVVLLALFWVIDIPQTVRLKAAIVRMLPLDPEFMNSTIEKLCAGAHSGSASTHCYMAFYSEEAAKDVADKRERKRVCQQLAQRLESGLEKDWYRIEPKTKEEIYKSAKDMTVGGDEGVEPNPDVVRRLTENNELSYFYTGDDPAFKEKGIMFFNPKNCEFQSFTHTWRYLR